MCFSPSKSIDRSYPLFATGFLMAQWQRIQERICLSMQRTWGQPLSQKDLLEKAEQPTPVFCLGNLMDRGAWQDIHRVTKETQLSD